MPGNEANVGHLTSEFHRLVQAARQSVTCATYNFESTSQMWDVLREASEQPGVVVTVYVDGDKADASKVKAQLPQATIYRSAVLPDGKQVVSHAKFIVIDHAMLLLTSANFSFSAENRNIELGLRIHDPALAASVETTMASKHGSLYELA
jgi:phosphatidylserine/phosphatidylglycerophosphate/cardiolipin synthase-like enzyme